LVQNKGIVHKFLEWYTVTKNLLALYCTAKESEQIKLYKLKKKEKKDHGPEAILKNDDLTIFLVGSSSWDYQAVLLVSKE